MRDKTLLVSMEELENIFVHSTMEEYYQAKEIFENCKDRDKTDRNWSFFSAVAAVYIAGKVQGIREERKRRMSHLRIAAQKEVSA